MPSDLKTLFRANPTIPQNDQQTIQKVDRFVSINPSILQLNEDQLDDWRSKDPQRRTITMEDIQTYKNHTTDSIHPQTVFSSPQQKVEIPPLNTIRTPQEFSLWLNNYRQSLPEEFRKRMYISPTDFMQKKVFYPKFWGLISSFLPPGEIEKLNTYTQSVKQSDIYPRFIYWKNHLPPQFRAMVPDELYQVYSYSKLYQKTAETTQKEPVFDTHVPVEPPHEEKKDTSTRKDTKNSRSKKDFFPREEIESDEPSFVTNDLPGIQETPTADMGELRETPLTIPEQSTQVSSRTVVSDVPSLPRQEIPEDSDENKQSSSHSKSPQDIQKQIKRAKQFGEDLKNPREALNRYRNTFQNKGSQIKNLAQKGRNLLKFGGEGAAGGGAAAGGGGFVVGGAGAATVGGIGGGTIALIIICILLILLVIGIAFAFIYGVWLTPNTDHFKRIIVQKTADKSQIPNPTDAKVETDTHITYTISASYDKTASGINIYDEIPENSVFVSAEGNFTAYDASGNIVVDPNSHQAAVKKIVWGITNKNQTTTATTPNTGTDKPSSWPTAGTVTQGPRGAFDHEGLYEQGLESVDIANNQGTPLYATFNALVLVADASCGSCGQHYGNYVVLSNDEKSFSVFYGHMITINVKQGDHVKQGDVIGYMGSTGFSTGPHTHYEFRNLSLAPPYIPQAITPPNCDPEHGIACSPNTVSYTPTVSNTIPSSSNTGYWFLLHRSRSGKQPTEDLYKGIYGDKSQSQLVMTNTVNPGIEGKSPTPLPSLLSKPYWVVTKKEQNQGDALKLMGPDFLVLNIDYQNEFNGPIGYDECGDSHNAQCFWPTPGEFGLHGVGDTPSRLSDSGSSGCVRHSNEAITSIYNLLKNETGEIRYYINND